MSKISFYIFDDYYQFEKKVLNRKKIYGEKKIIPVDKNGNECDKGYLNETGTSLYLSKCSSFCELTDEGLYVEKPKTQKKLDETLRFEEEKSSYFSQYSLLFITKQAYILEGPESYRLAYDIGDKIFKNYNGDKFLFQRNGTLFLITKDNMSDYYKNDTFVGKDTNPFFEEVPFFCNSIDEIDFENL